MQSLRAARVVCLPLATWRHAAEIERSIRARSDQPGKLVPWLDRPGAAGCSGGGRQYEHVGTAGRAGRLQSVCNRTCRSPQPTACGALAGEGDRARTKQCDFLCQPGRRECLACNLMVHAGGTLGHIGEANPEIEKTREFVRLEPSRRDPCLEQATPEPVAGMCVIGADGG